MHTTWLGGRPSTGGAVERGGSAGARSRVVLVTGEPARIRAFAVRLRREAAVVRGTALRVAAMEQVRWRSPAVEAFRGRVDGAARHLLRTARFLDEAAEAVDAHALAVERTLEELAALARRVLGPVSGGR